MGRRKDFVSDGLYALREKHRERISQQDENEEQEKVTEPEASPDNADPKTEPKAKIKIVSDPEPSLATKAIKVSTATRKTAVKRIDEYVKTKRDLTTRIHQNMALLEEEGEKLRRNADQAASLTVALGELLKSFENILETPDNEDSVQEAEQELEALRIELFRTKVKVDSLLEKLKPQSGTGQISLLPELNSLTQIQMFKMGLCFALPLIIALLAGCALVAWAVGASMGGFR
ncbi:MAG: hypothetical protein GY750_10525 [Lentisphaerae bacterium]|nr:hypothetical protein [Lentisphaerota bacterium]MCP4101846.1 hypothetical protein [Lentisphaerota bacterium]